MRVLALHMAAGDGRVFFYCFGQDRQQPVKLLDVCGSSVPVYALAFNHKAPELFAAVDRQAVKVSSISYYQHIGVLVQPDAV